MNLCASWRARFITFLARSVKRSNMWNRFRMGPAKERGRESGAPARGEAALPKECVRLKRVRDGR